MNSADGIDKTSGLPFEQQTGSMRRSDLKKLPKSAEDYVMIANRLAAQREKPKTGTPLDSVASELRNRYPR